MASNPQVPEGWRLARLEDVAEVNPRRPQLDIKDDSLVPFVPMAAVGEDCAGILDRALRPYREVARGYSYFETDDLLFAKITPCLQNGKHTLANGLDGGFGFGTTEFHVIRANAGNEPRFLFRILTQPSNIEKCTRSFSGTAGQQRVQPEVLRSLRFLLPPLPEQRAIAAVLDSIDDAIERTDDLIAAAERLRDALLHDLLSQGLPGRHTEWKEVRGLGTIPATWQTARLGDVLALNQPGAWGDEPTDDDPGVRVLRAADLTRDGRVETATAARRRLSERDRERRLMRNGDLILERSGGGPTAPVGRVALIEESDPIYCSNFCQHLRVDPARLDARFAARALWHRYMRGVTERLEQRTTGIRNLDYAGYLLLPIPIPSMEEQEVIAAALDSAEAAIDREREERTALESLKASTADALLTGQTRLS